MKNDDPMVQYLQNWASRCKHTAQSASSNQHSTAAISNSSGSNQQTAQAYLCCKGVWQAQGWASRRRHRALAGTKNGQPVTGARHMHSFLDQNVRIIEHRTMKTVGRADERAGHKTWAHNWTFAIFVPSDCMDSTGLQSCVGFNATVVSAMLSNM